MIWYNILEKLSLSNKLATSGASACFIVQALSVFSNLLFCGFPSEYSESGLTLIEQKQRDPPPFGNAILYPSSAFLYPCRAGNPPV